MYKKAVLASLLIVTILSAFCMLRFYASYRTSEGVVQTAPMPDVFRLMEGEQVHGAVFASNFHSRQLDWGWGRTYIGPRPKPGQRGRMVYIAIWRRHDHTMFQWIEIYWPKRKA